MAKTKAKWRNRKLQFSGGHMYVSGSVASTGFRSTGAILVSTQIVHTNPYWVGDFTTERKECFRTVVGGLMSVSSAVVTFSLRWAGTNITTLSFNTAAGAAKSTMKPFHVEWNGRITKVSSSAHISAVGFGWTKYAGGTTWVADGTTGSTAQSPRYGTSNINLVAANTSWGLNVAVSADTSSAHVFVTHAYTQWFA